jgi:ferrochelatase
MQPWLGPDVLDHLKMLAAEGVKEVVIAPIGFVSDHMEIVYDLDFEAQNVARELGMKLVRAATAGTHPSFVKMIRELMLERILERIEATRTGLCAPGCCVS